MPMCFRCKSEWKSTKRVPAVKETCEQCGAYLHCCKNCKHHDPKVHNQCYIPNTAWVGDREGCNFCDEFEFKATGVSGAATPEVDSAKSQLSALFGDAPTPPGPEKLDKFKDLFGD